MERNDSGCGVMGRATRLLFALVILTTISIDFGSADVNELPDLRSIPTPPSFKHDPNPPIIYFVVDFEGKTPTANNQAGNVDSLKERRLICEADGYPEPTCKWLKDGAPLNVDESNTITQQEGYGTITISNLKKSDEGTYQCYCENGNGTAYDRPIQLQQTYIDFFPPSNLETIPVELGKPFSRSCTPPLSVPPARVFWIYKGAGKSSSSLTAFNSINSSHIAMNDKGEIFIQYVKEDDIPDNLFFTCTVENMELKDYKFGDQFNIKVIKTAGRPFPPYIAPQEQFVSPSRVTALRGESFELFCIFSGFPDQMPRWRKIQGDDIDWTRVTYATNFNKSLKIENVQFSDEGFYECSFLDDPANNRAKRFQVVIESAPKWNPSAPHSVNSSEEETVEFDCRADARPEPKYTFFKNGKEIMPDNYRVFVEGSKLRIHNLRAGENGQGDNAAYQCKVENKYGFIWANFYLNLLSFRPVLLDGPGDTVVVEGRDPALSCRFFGSPRPKVTWTTPQASSSQNSEYDPSGVYRLRLFKATPEYGGSYECYAENKHGNTTGKGTLTVRKPTILTAVPTDQKVVAGNVLRLPCNAKPDPNLKMRVFWLKYGMPIDANNGRYVVEANNSLRIDGVVGVDTGEYTCVAETDYDRTERTAKIVVKDVPTPPMGVWVKCDETSAALDFHYVEMSQETPATDFFAQYNIDADAEPHNWETYPIPGKLQQDRPNHGNIRVDLHPYGNFSFRLIARNEIGDSAPTPGDKRCATRPARPEKNPAKVLVKGSTPEDLTVYWEPMPRRDWNGPKFYYEVKYKPKNGEESTEIVEDPDRSSLVIPVTEPFQEYEVTVRAKNELGESTTTPRKVTGRSGEEKPKTAPTGFMAFTVPNQPTVARFKWDRYNGSGSDSRGFKGELKGFKIEHWVETNKRAEPVRKVALFDPAATSGLIYDMKPNTRNYARIMAYSGGGDGPASPEETITMPEGVPTAVQSLEVFALSHTEVGAVWQNPREMNGNFIGYNVSWCKIRTGQNLYRVDDDSCVRATDLIVSNYYRIAGLTENQEYRVMVSALTGAGAGESNSADVRSLPRFLPAGPPVTPAVHEAGIAEDHINVTWLPGKFLPTEQRPVGDDHYVEYRPKGEDTWIKVPNQGKNFTVQVVGLQPGTTYEVRTVSVAENKPQNLESRSEIVELTTAGDAPVTSTAGWLIAIIVAIIILIIILIIVCLIVRNRGAKYPVSEKEKEQGREPMLNKEEKGFGEYSRPDVDEEKRSLTAESKPESETDSMAEYGDGEGGRFTEDGSFIGQYSAPNKVITAQSGASPGTQVVVTTDRGGKANLSTFV